MRQSRDPIWLIGAAALAAALLALVLAVAPALAARGPFDAEASSRAAARETALRLLDRLVLPSGSRHWSAIEGTRPLNEPQAEPAPPRHLDLHGFWQLPGEAGAMLNWIEHHPPRGARAGHRGTAPDVWFTSFTFTPSHPAVESETLVIALTRSLGRGTLLRADAEVAWKSPFPPGATPSPACCEPAGGTEAGSQPVIAPAEAQASTELPGEDQARLGPALSGPAPRSLAQ